MAQGGIPFFVGVSKFWISVESYSWWPEEDSEVINIETFRSDETLIEKVEIIDQFALFL